METNVRVRKSILWLLSGKQAGGRPGFSMFQGCGLVFPRDNLLARYGGVEANGPAPSPYNQVDNSAYYVPMVCAFKPQLPWEVDTIIITLILQMWKQAQKG